MSYDIFISYKAQDDNGYETRDSAIARELHGKLTEMGCSVFFSEKTMEDLGASSFGLEIDNALASAKMMIVVLTNREYASASWVKHEWSTFYSVNPNNRLYTLTEKLNVCDLPPTLRAKQNFDYAKDGVSKLCNFIRNARDTEFSLVSAKDIEDFIEKEGVGICKNKYGGFTAEILKESSFLEIRKKLIKNSKGKIILVGQSLRDAFTYGNNACVIDTLKNCIEEKQLSEIKFLITDPAMFNINSELQQQGDTPLDRVSTTMTAIIGRILPSCKKNGCCIKVFFTPLIYIDHAIINSDFMAFRSTKLWTQDAAFKGAFFIYKKYEKQNPDGIKSEYEAHSKYLEKIMDNCTKIDLDIDIIKKDDNRYDNLPEAMKRHYKWRNEINEFDYRDCIELYKLHNTQLVNYVIDTWSIRNEKVFLPSDSHGIKNDDDLFDSQNLLNDKTQEILLKYIKTTEKMFEAVVRQYDSTVIDYNNDKEYQSWVKVFPSLDLGFPNNVQRLAGGFATGMFIMWKCVTPIVPIDATVNVCSSSVFEIDKAKIDLNMDCDNFKEWIESKEENRKGIIEKISKEKHCKFSFDNGNHFLMIAQDQNFESENFKKFYLVLHSSAVEFKESYVGLYPTENNWYSDYIKTKEFNDNDGRYIRYIKDKEAASFIDFAHKLEKYNIQLHKYVAEAIGCVRNTELEQNTFHHYYMPNDSSIAIGTYVERPGTVVPLFSNVGKPIYMFEIGQDNWKIKLPGKGEVCLVPHGWGQEIDNIQSVKLKINKNGDENKIILEKLKTDNVDELEWDITSNARIKEDDKHKSIGKHIRNFEDGQTFLDKGKKMIKGKIIQTLTPIYLYCNAKKGKINEPVQ